MEHTRRAHQRRCFVQLSHAHVECSSLSITHRKWGRFFRLQQVDGHNDQGFRLGRIELYGALLIPAGTALP